MYKEYLWLYQGKEIAVSEQALSAIMQKRNIRAACFGNQNESTLLSQEELLLDERYVQNGILLERNLLSEVGGKNRRIPAKWEYELAIRIAEREEVMLLPMAEFQELLDVKEQEKTENVAVSWEDFCVDAYVMARYSIFLKERNLFEQVLEAVLNEGIAVRDNVTVKKFLEDMIMHTKRYYDYYDATQPILIYRGDECCYNMLNVFADELAKALEKKGNKVVFYDVGAEDIKGMVNLLGKRFQASIGFQSWILSIQRKENEAYFQDMIGGPKYNFILDHPIWMQGQLRHVPERYYILTHDRNYKAFIEKYDKEVANTYLLPPGGRTAGITESLAKRVYNVTFLGTYGNYRKNLAAIAGYEPQMKFLAARYLLYMKRNPDTTAEEVFQKVLEYRNIHLEEEDFLSLFGKMKAVIQCIMYYYREKTIETILNAEIEIHVYGDSWEESPYAKNPFLKIHKAVYGKQVLRELGMSKISLNIMAWHKDGFTERIAESMLSGAVVVSDKSTQLEDFYGSETVLFQLNALEKLPVILKKLLEDEERMKQIASAAKEKALAKATWDVRAEALQKMIDEECKAE